MKKTVVLPVSQAKEGRKTSALERNPSFDFSNGSSK